MKSRGVLLVNLGSPDSPGVSDVRRYLREFLMDKRVIDSPFLVRFLVVNGAIVPFRAAQSAEAYDRIWQPEGSPLILTSRSLQRQLQERFPELLVELAMRYQNPSIPDAVQRLCDAGVKELFLVPLFPHYAMSSYESAVERVKEVARKRSPEMRISVLEPYYNDPAYIRSLVASASEFLRRDYDHLLFSFHGLPLRHLRKSDPTCQHCLTVENCCETPSPAHATCYRAQCFKTVRSFVTRSPVKNYSVAFQSRLGRDPWLEPYTDREIVRLAREGVRKLIVICPAFVSDCLETIEEIGIRGHELFRESGGEELVLVPCLNTHPQWINALEMWILRHFVLLAARPPSLGQSV